MGWLKTTSSRIASALTDAPEPRHLLEKSIRTHLAPLLRADGFAGSDRRFRRMAGDMIHVVTVQRSRLGDSFALNLGLHPVCIPDALSNPPLLSTMTAELCEFRRRLARSGADQWWSYDGTKRGTDAEVADAAAVYADIGRPAFAAASASDSPLRVLTPQDFERGDWHLYGFENMPARIARDLALIRLAEGNTNEASAFARQALRIIGSGISGSGLRSELEIIASANNRERKP